MFYHFVYRHFKVRNTSVIIKHVTISYGYESPIKTYVKASPD